MERVDVLLRVDGLDDAAFVDVLWQRELDDDSVNVWVGVQLRENREQLLLACLFGQRLFNAADSALGAVFFLVVDIEARRRIVPDDHHRQRGHDAARRKMPDLFFDLRALFCGKRLAVNDLGCH